MNSSMDIRSAPGTQVRYLGTGGYDHHKKFANERLTVGETYTVKSTDVSGWHTDVYLNEVEGGFNSVMFEEE